MHGPEDSNIIPRPKAAAVPIYPLLGWIQVANCTFRLPLYLFESSFRAAKSGCLKHFDRDDLSGKLLMPIYIVSPMIVRAT